MLAYTEKPVPLIHKRFPFGRDGGRKPTNNRLTWKTWKTSIKMEKEEKEKEESLFLLRSRGVIMFFGRVGRHCIGKLYSYIGNYIVI